MPETDFLAGSANVLRLRGHAKTVIRSHFRRGHCPYADPENEALIQQAISKLVAGKTLIVVAHRLNTIRNADQILVVANGNIAGVGHKKNFSGNAPSIKRCGKIMPEP